MDTALAGMILAFLLTVVIGGFILLYPLSRRAALLLEQRLRERAQSDDAAGDDRIGAMADALRALEGEVEALAEKQEFLERMLAKRDESRLRAGTPSSTGAD